MPSAGLQPLCYTRGYDMCVAILLPSREKTAFLCVFFDCFAYVIFEVIMMDQTETINGKLYLRAEDGSIVIVEEPFEIEMLTGLPGWLSHFDD